MTINLGGATGVQRLLQHLDNTDTERRPHIIYLQDHRLHGSDDKYIIKRTQELGYRLFLADPTTVHLNAEAVSKDYDGDNHNQPPADRDTQHHQRDPANCTQQRRSQRPVHIGGAALLATVRLPAKPAFTVSHHAGQAVGAFVAGNLHVSTYTRPRDGAGEYCACLAEEIVKHRHNTTFYIAGDWNEEPDQNTLRHYIHHLQPTTAATDAPTRWSGSKTLDYLVHSATATIHDIRLGATPLSDHIPVLWTIEYGKQLNGDANNDSRHILYDDERWTLTPTLNLRRPNSTEKQAHADAVRNAWLTIFGAGTTWAESYVRQMQTGLSTTSAAWSHIEARIEATLVRAIHEVLPTASTTHTTAGKRPRGNVEFCRPQPSRRNPCDSATFQSRRWWRHLQRLRELQRQQTQRRRTNITDNFCCWQLIQRLDRDNLTDTSAPTSMRVAQAQRHLDDAEQKAKHLRVRQWRLDMKDDKKLFAWLRNNYSPHTPHILMEGTEPHVDDAQQWEHTENTDTHSLGDPRLTTSMEHALHALTQYWRKIWGRTTPDDTEDLNATIGPPRSAQQWPPLTHDELRAAATRQAGKSAGTDGWHGDDLQLLQHAEGAWEGLALIFEHFEQHGLPHQWSTIRQAHKPKLDDATEAKLGAPTAKVGKLRPISVSSVWYRLWSSARARHPSTALWMASWVPKGHYGGLPHRSTEHAIAHLAAAVDAGQTTIVTTDLEKAFDHCNPRDVIRRWRHLGMPRWLTDDLEQFWQRQRRHLSYGKHITYSSHDASASLPQGDPWAMLGMITLLVGPHNYLQRMYSDCTLVGYVDDRTWCAPTPQRARLLLDDWASWTAKLGFKENPNKTQVYTYLADHAGDLQHYFQPEHIHDYIHILGTSILRDERHNHGTTDDDNRRKDSNRRTYAKQVRHPPPPFSDDEHPLAATGPFGVTATQEQPDPLDADQQENDPDNTHDGSTTASQLTQGAPDRQRQPRHAAMPPTQKEQQQLNAAHTTLRRIQLLREPWNRHARAAAATASAKASWGWLSHLPQYGDVQNYQRHVRDALRVSSSVDLTLLPLVAGHRLALDFQAGQQRTMSTLRWYLTDDPYAPAMQHDGIWHTAIDTWMQRHGWRRATTPLAWHHSATNIDINWPQLKQGILNATAMADPGPPPAKRPRQQPRAGPLDDDKAPRRPTTADTLKWAAHTLREAWRAHRYNTWQGKATYAARRHQAAPYNSERMSATRTQATASRNHLTIMTAGAISDARLATATYGHDNHLDDATRRGRRRCTLCATRSGTWHHILWECHNNDHHDITMNDRAARDDLTNYLAWPSGGKQRDKRTYDMDDHIQAHICATREALLKARYDDKRQAMGAAAPAQQRDLPRPPEWQDNDNRTT